MKKGILAASLAFLLPILLCFVFLAAPLRAETSRRVVILSPDVAEIVVALQGEATVIGKESFTKAPTLAHAKNIGLFRNLTAEPIVALKPDLVLGSYMAHPASIYAQLEKSGLVAVNVAPEDTPEDFFRAILDIGRLLGKAEAGEALARQWREGMSARRENGKRYLLSYDGRYVAGRHTVGDLLIRLAGGINAAADVEGLKPLSREGWLMAKPDVVVIAEHNLGVVGGSLAHFAAQPELKNSRAAQNGKIVTLSATKFLTLSLETPHVVETLRELGAD
ncbi:MAG: ABC transporter substrate-binding protein [Zoogloeaceae bacterium]|jgi:iron complex transport system substrate-binding protein|nr:ABC transporter substrate-binding protein [Zoogloeaceae bacterium]